MSRLDYKRKREKELARKMSGESAFLSFVKEHSGLIALAVIVAVVAAAALIIGFNPDFADRFANKEGESIYLDENTLFETPVTSYEKIKIKPLGSGFVIYDGEKMKMFSDGGKVEWELDMVMNNPVLSSEGGYIMAADRGGKDIYLINNGKVILKTLSQYNIINASVAADGKFVVISDEPYFKSLITVKDAGDKEIFVWHSGSSYIVDAVIGSDANKLAAAVLSTEEQSGFSGGVMLFNLYDKEPYKTQLFEGCLASNVFRADKGFTVVTDKKAVFLNSDGEILNEHGYNGKSINKICKSADMTVLSLEAENGNKSITALDNAGKLKCSFNVHRSPNFLSADSGRIAYGGGNEVAVCDDSGKELYLIQTAKDFETLAFLGGARRAAALSPTSLDIIEIK